MRVMGIDPGLTRCGLGVVDVDESRRASLVYVGVARTDKDLATHFRLRTIADAIDTVIEQYRPEVVAIERVFAQDNLQSVTTTMQVMGAAVVARILGLAKAPKPAAAADALAIAITHAWRGTGLLGAPEDSSVAVSISGRLTSRGSMTPAQRAWAEAQAAQRRTGAVDPRRRRG